MTGLLRKLIGKPARGAPPAPPAHPLADASGLFAQGRFHEAYDAMSRLDFANVTDFRACTEHGWTCLRTGRADDAERWMRKALDTAPEDPDCLHGLATVLAAQRRFDEALATATRGLVARPGHFDLLNLLGSCRLAAGNAEGAEAAFRRAILARADSPAPWRGLGTALERQDRYAAAQEAIRRAYALETASDSLDDSYVGLAINLANAGDVEAALDLYERNLPQRPSILGSFARALALLSQAPTAEGWSAYEFRWMNARQLPLRPRYPRPVWHGQDLRGRTLLVRAEQGYGDIVQFARFLPRLKALGATVLLQVHAGMERFAQSFRGVDQVLQRGELPPFDFYIHLMSLPRVLDVPEASLAADVPYVDLASASAVDWSARLGSGPEIKVGLAWSGNPTHERERYRSITLDTLAPLRDVPGVRWFSLQKGAAEADAERRPSALPLSNLAPDLRDFCDTAAAIARLDLVLCVDTFVAHLAGAMGKPVWMLLPTPSDWRWLRGRDDSPWYPSMRLFRQRGRGDWADVILRVKSALSGLARLEVAAVTSNGEARPPAAPAVRNQGASPGIRPGFCGCTEARVGILQYPPHDDPVGRSLDWYGEYLHPQLELLSRLVRPGATALEVGPGLGAHAVFLASHLGDDGHLMLVEPRRVLQQMLAQNLAANGAVNVTLLRLALTRHDDAAAAPGATVDALKLERVALVKTGDGVDAADVLAGATETLWRLRPLLFLAADGDTQLEALGRQARESGYRCWRMATPLFEPGNFNRRDADIFGGRVALALLGIPEETEADVASDRCVELR
jgi:Flp pilus assembly protein TadD